MNGTKAIKTRQAVVAIGGRASRLRADGVNVPISKSFIHVSGRPLLFWCLEFLYMAGIRELILCADEPVQKRAADAVLRDLPIKFANVIIVDDPGVGVHCLPYHARRHLHDQYLFECGHNVTLPSHYYAMEKLKAPDNVVFSAFDPHPNNLRYPVRRVNGAIIRGLQTSAPDQFAFAHPLLIDRSYAEILPYLGFNFINIVDFYSFNGALAYVKGIMPPEFDIKEELIGSMAAYGRLCNLRYRTGRHARKPARPILDQGFLPSYPSSQSSPESVPMMA
jgi:hypothetical protein